MRTGALVVLIGCSLSMLVGCEGRVDLGDRGAQAGVTGGGGSSTAPPEEQTLGVGDLCIPTIENDESFPGFAPSEVNVETGLFQGKNLACLVTHFRGRVSCPEGQSQELADKVAALVDLHAQDPFASPADAGITPDEEARLCRTPISRSGHGSLVQVPIKPQCASRPAAGASYYSCRCGGADPDAAYCACPASFACLSILELALGADVSGATGKVAGSYCVRAADVTTDAQGQPALAPDPDCQP